MSIDGYKAVGWQQGEVLTDAKLNIMTQNDQLFFESIPDTLYQAMGGIQRTTGIKILIGATPVPPTKQSFATKTIEFPNFFTVDTYPVLSLHWISDATLRVHLASRGIGQLHPDHRGFIVRASVDATTDAANHIAKLSFIHWIAHGI